VALDLLSRKAWTRQELRQRLGRRGTPPDVAEALVADLEARGYLDDRAYAVAWADTRAREQGYGSRRLRDTLLARGVARPLVEAAVGAALAGADEENRARTVARRRLAALRRGRSDTVARRLRDHLLRRGYPPGVVRRVVRETCPETVESD
jgi:regulatory protein